MGAPRYHWILEASRLPKKDSIRPHQSEADLIQPGPLGQWEITSEQINLAC